MDESDAREAQTENVFRAGNEAIRTNVGAEVDGIVLICECGDAQCLERIGVRREEYEAVRRNPRAFVIARGHEERADEAAVVIDETERFVVIEKLDDAGKIAERFDPRRTERGS